MCQINAVIYLFVYAFAILFIKIGVTYTKPLLLPPEVVIGGFGKIQVGK